MARVGDDLAAGPGDGRGELGGGLRAEELVVVAGEDEGGRGDAVQRVAGVVAGGGEGALEQLQAVGGRLGACASGSSCPSRSSSRRRARSGGRG